MWDFVNHKRRLIKTFKAAVEECERHKRLWTKAIEATGVRALKELFGGKLPLGLPLWARKKLDRRLYAILIDNRPGEYRTEDEEDETCTENTPASSDAPGPGGPIKTSDSSASPTEAVFGNPYPCLACQGQGTVYDPEDPPCPVEGSKYRRTIRCAACGGPAKGRKKPAAKRTGNRRSVPAREGRVRPPRRSGQERSRSSRKTKSVPCRS